MSKFYVIEETFPAQITQYDVDTLAVTAGPIETGTTSVGPANWEEGGAELNGSLYVPYHSTASTDFWSTVGDDSVMKLRVHPADLSAPSTELDTSMPFIKAMKNGGNVIASGNGNLYAMACTGRVEHTWSGTLYRDKDTIKIFEFDSTGAVLRTFDFPIPPDWFTTGGSEAYYEMAGEDSTSIPSLAITPDGSTIYCNALAPRPDLGELAYWDQGIFKCDVATGTITLLTHTLDDAVTAFITANFPNEGSPDAWGPYGIGGMACMDNGDLLIASNFYPMLVRLDPDGNVVQVFIGQNAAYSPNDSVYATTYLNSYDGIQALTVVADKAYSCFEGELAVDDGMGGQIYEPDGDDNTHFIIEWDVSPDPVTTPIALLDTAGPPFISLEERPFCIWAGPADPTGCVIHRFAGDGTNEYSPTNPAVGDGGPAVDARFNFPVDVAFSPTGEGYVADYANARIRKIDTSGDINTVVGNGDPDNTGDGGDAASAKIQIPTSVCFDAFGNLHIAHLDLSGADQNVIRRVDAITNVIDTLIAFGGSISTVASIICDNSGYIYANQQNQILRIAPNGTSTVFAGTGTAGYSGDGGLATAAELNAPSGLATDGTRIWFCDQGNKVIRMIQGGTIQTVAGTGGTGYAGDDGPALAATFGTVTDVKVHGGNLFILDGTGVRRVDRDGMITTVVGGPGGSGAPVDGGAALGAGFTSPGPIRLAFKGDDLYVVDYPDPDSAIWRVSGPCVDSEPPALAGFWGTIRGSLIPFPIAVDVGQAVENDTAAAITASLVASGPTFVAVGLSSPAGDTIESSADGTVWTTQSAPFTAAAQGLAYGGGLWVAGCAFVGGTGERIATSPDGITWTARSSPLDDGACRDAFYTGSSWLAFGPNSSFQGKIVKSADGISWSAVSGTYGFGPAAMGFDGTTLVLFAGGFDGNVIRTSTDGGDTWTVQTTPFDGNECYCGVWNGSLWVAGGYDSSDHCIMTSPDAITWTQRNTPLDTHGFTGSPYVAGITWNGSMFVAIGRSGDRDKIILTSADGINWTHRASSFDDATHGDGSDVTWGASLGLWVAGTNFGSIATSPDGITWTDQTNSLANVQKIVAKA